MVVKESGREPVKGINPDEGVAIGALYWGLVARSRAGTQQPPKPVPKKK